MVNYPEDGQIFNVLAVIYRRKIVMFVSLFVCCLASLLAIRISPPKFTAEMIVGPVDAKSDALSKLSSLTPLLGGSLGQVGQKPIDQFRARIFSDRVATIVEDRTHVLRELTPELWNSEEGKWLRPKGVIAELSGIFHWVVGIPVSDLDKPGDRLRDFIRKQVKVKDFLDGPYVSISLETKNAEAAKKLLAELYQVTEDDIKAEKTLQMSTMVDYIDNRLKTVTINENRVALIQVLTDLEREEMLASSNTPYAAVMVDQPETSNKPTSPNFIVFIGVGLLLGIAVGAGISIALYQRDTRATGIRIRNLAVGAE